MRFPYTLNGFYVMSLHRQIKFTLISRELKLWISREIHMNYTSTNLIRETHEKSVKVKFTWIFLREVNIIFWNKVIHTIS